MGGMDPLNEREIVVIGADGVDGLPLFVLMRAHGLRLVLMEGPRVRGRRSCATCMVWGGESVVASLLWDQVEVEGKRSARGRAQG